MHKKFLLILIFFIVLVPNLMAFEPISSKFYDFAEDIYIKYDLQNFSYSFPYSRKEIVKLLKEINEKKENLNNVEKEILKYYQRKYSSYIDNFKNDEFHLYSYKKEKGNLFLDFVGRMGQVNDEYDFKIDDKLSYIVYTSGLTFKGNITDNMDYYFYFVDETMNGELENIKGSETISYIDEYGDNITKTYSLIEKYFENKGVGWINTGFRVDKSEIYFDTTEVYMNFYLPYLTLEIGKNKNSWGPGEISNVMLSDNSTSYVQFKNKLDLGKFKLTSLTAKLRTDELDPNTEIETDVGDTKYQYRKKYLAAHRLEIDLSKNIKIGLNESVIYADKDLQLGYMIPFNFFWSEQHYEGDRDNSSMGIDFSVKPFNRFSFYGEIFLDDLSVSELNDYRHTKYSYIVGLKYYPKILSNTKISLEYSRVNPIVYTHKFNIDNFTHYNSNIGSFLYPNSEYYYVGLKKRWNSKLTSNIYYYRQNHGDNYIDNEGYYINVGGDMYYPDRLSGTTEDRKYSFLNGVKEKTKSMGIKLSYLIEWKNLYKNLSINNLYLKFNAEYNKYIKECPENIDEVDNYEKKLTKLKLFLQYNYH